MSEYFAFSQRVKEKIMADAAMMDVIRKHMDGKYAPFIDGGTSNNHYRIGRLESGLWVAIRQRLDSEKIGTSQTCLSLYESYCRTAEDLATSRKRVTRFCIGVVKPPNAALLIEDLTEGGKRRFIESDNPIAGRFEDNTDGEVYLDLDYDEDIRNFIYFNTQARINL